MQTAALRERPPAGLSPRAELLATPFFAQAELQCGPAALATALGAVGIEAWPPALAAEVFLPSRGGSLQAEMIAGARRHAAVATQLPPELSAVLHEVDAGHAVVVLLNLGLALVPAWHYAVVVGYDLPAGEVLLRSGSIRREVLAMRTFEYTWARSGHWSFVALPAGVWPEFADEAAVVEAAVGFERLASAEAALRAYEAAARRWPANLVFAMGVGNTRYALGDKHGAARAFREAAERSGDGAAWVNLANVLLEQGDVAAAAEAARRALEDQRWRSQAREVLERAGAALRPPGI